MLPYQSWLPHTWWERLGKLQLTHCMLLWDMDNCKYTHTNFNVAQHSIIQEGKHPLTGQRAANFRLLANQWAKRRLVTQWRHGCRAMRPSVCNAGASNVGRSLCVQISRERSYTLPIYKNCQRQSCSAITCLSSGINITRKAIDCATTLLLTDFI